MRIQADIGKCQGYGNCVGVDADHFDLDDDGLVIVVDETVADAATQTVAAAVRSCPVDAIWTVAE